MILLFQGTLTVARWMENRADELVGVEMGSYTKVERNHSKAAIEQFVDRMKAVARRRSMAQ